MVINENEYSFSLSKRDRDDLLLSRKGILDRRVTIDTSRIPIMLRYTSHSRMLARTTVTVNSGIPSCYVH